MFSELVMQLVMQMSPSDMPFITNITNITFFSILLILILYLYIVRTPLNMQMVMMQQLKGFPTYSNFRICEWALG